MTDTNDEQGSFIEQTRLLLQRALDESSEWSNTDDVFGHIVRLTEALRQIRRAIAAAQERPASDEATATLAETMQRPRVRYDVVATRLDVEYLASITAALLDIVADEDLFQRAIAPAEEDLAAQQVGVILRSKPLEVFEIAANLMLFESRNIASVDIRRDGFEFRSGSTGLQAAPSPDPMASKQVQNSY